MQTIAQIISVIITIFLGGVVEMLYLCTSFFKIYNYDVLKML